MSLTEWNDTGILKNTDMKNIAQWTSKKAFQSKNHQYLPWSYYSSTNCNIVGEMWDSYWIWLWLLVWTY